eukprot:Gb_11114 [translate_table: standard]
MDDIHAIAHIVLPLKPVHMEEWDRWNWKEMKRCLQGTRSIFILLLVCRSGYSCPLVVTKRGGRWEMDWQGFRWNKKLNRGLVITSAMFLFAWVGMKYQQDPGITMGIQNMAIKTFSISVAVVAQEINECWKVISGCTKCESSLSIGWPYHATVWCLQRTHSYTWLNLLEAVLSEDFSA